MISPTEIDRQFIQTEPKPKDGNIPAAQTLNEFFDRHTIVILGEPGLGKTTSLKSASKKEQNATFVRMGEFLSATSLTLYAGKTLYLDGLDEHRSKANGVDVMDALIGRLKQLDCPPIRISCRTAEWRSSTDLSALNEVSNQHPVFKLELMPLSRSDIYELIPDAGDFIDGARSRGLESLLENPQDLSLLYGFYQERNSWPLNRSELFEGACKILLKESNKAHYEAIDDWVTDHELGRTSDYLAAILLLSNVSGIAIDRTNSSKAFPPIHEFAGNLFSMKAATGRHVFRGAGDKRIEPKHRMIAEYMAARYLATRVREGLSLRRVMALLTGVDGGTPPDLRGVYAWLVTLLSGMAHRILVHDPYAAVIYGDAYSWTPSTKKIALASLEQHAKKDPWFREQDTSQEALGGLSDDALLEDFQRLLRDDSGHSHLLGTVLDAISGGPPLEGIANDLMTFIRRTDRPGHLKSQAINAFAHSAPDRSSELIKLLEDVASKNLPDEDDYLRGALLRNLYPDTIGPADIVKYISTPSASIIGWYHLFLIDRIFELTTPDGLKTIAQSLQSTNLIPRKKVGDHYLTRFISGLVRRLIENFGLTTIFPEMAQWLSLGDNEHGGSVFRDSDASKMRQFFEAHKEIYLGLFLHYLERGMSDDKPWHQIWWRFREVVSQASPPYDFPVALIEQLEEHPSDSQEAISLFELACDLVMNQEPTQPSIPLDSLTELAKKSAALQAAYDRCSQCPIQEWRQRDAMRKEEEFTKRETHRSQNIAELTKIRDKIIDGRAISVLEFYARIWFGLFTDVDRNATPRTRLAAALDDSLARDVEQGFKASLNEKNFHTLREIAKTDAEQKSFHRGYLMLAAMDAASEEGEAALLHHSDGVLSLAIAYSIANVVDAPIPWLTTIQSAKPELYEHVLESYWRAQIEAGAERLSDFYTFNKDDVRLPHIARILPRLLRDHPLLPPRLLEDSLVNLVNYCSPDTVYDLVNVILKKSFRDTRGQRTMWLSVGFSVSPAQYFTRLKKQIDTDERRKWAARKILLADIWKRGSDGRLIASADKKSNVVELLGSAFKNVHFESRGEARFISDRDEPTAANEVRNLIHSFGQDPSNLASSALKRLLNNPALSDWRTDILYAMANQVRTTREARFTFPDVSKVVATLADAEPANVSDLKALVLDAILEIADDLRHGNTDGWKSFWNTDHHGKPTATHRNEEIARDRLLDHLRPKLRHLDIVAEPEVRYAEAKRSDVAVYCSGMKLPVEIKRDDHSEVWVAAEDQLRKQYSRDPASEGNGIFLAFWFDGKGMKLPPKPHKKPLNSGDFEKTLRFLIPESSTGLIDVIVVDVSRPIPAGALQKEAKKRVPAKKSVRPKKKASSTESPGKLKASKADRNVERSKKASVVKKLGRSKKS